MNFSKTWHEWTPWLTLLMGLTAFWIWAGAYTLAPGHIGWVMSGIDTPTHYLGWQFFRHSSWWQWPLGKNPADGSDAPGSIVMSDSIPLLALLFKVFSAWLPRDFQYFGLWALSCFLLQAWFARKLLARLTRDPVICLAGTGFFLGATVFLLRVYMHPALSAQWVLIAGIYLIFDARFRSRAWLLLLCITVLVHAYLFVMLAAISAGDIAQRCWRREYPAQKMLMHAGSAIASVVLLMWAAGYFSKGAVLAASIRGHLDLFFFLWTGIRYFGEWSSFLPGSNMDLLAYDGFGYLGAGFLVLLLMAVASSVLRIMRKTPETIVDGGPLSRWIVLIVICSILFIYALGNKVYLKQHLIFSYGIPAWLDHVYEVFRAPARMMWPGWYLLLFSVFYLLLKTIPLRYLRCIVVAALLLQLGDLSRAALDIRACAAKNRSWHSTMAAPLWAELASHYQHVAYLLPASVPVGMVAFMPSYRAVGEYAATNGMSLNIAYLARVDDQKMAAARAVRIALLSRGRAEPGTFYVIEDDSLWKQLLCVPDSTFWFGRVDGLKVIVPTSVPGLGKLPRDTCGA
jgi:hypothetical protein